MAYRRSFREILRLRFLTTSLASEGMCSSLGRASRQPISGFLHPEDMGSSKGKTGAAWLFLAAGVTAYSTSMTALAGSYLSLEAAPEEAAEPAEPVPKLPAFPSGIKPRIVFVLGGPGSGKGTQCSKIVDDFGFVHLSAGDLLRAELNSGSENGNMIKNMIKEGKIVPAEVTVALLQKAMVESGSDKFLIDGFPRNEENRVVFERDTGIEPEFILFFDCPEEVMEKRLLGRNQGRIDDNIETIRKRFRVFIESSLPVVEHYEKLGKVRKINATKTPDDVFKSLAPLFLRFLESELLEVSKSLLHAIDSGDYATYAKLCDPGLTAFEPEAQGHLVDGLDFHKYYFDLKGGKPADPVSTDTQEIKLQSTISSPRVVLLDNIGLVTYTRLTQKGEAVVSFNETRVWQRCKGASGKWEWKHLHFHRSKGISQ